jgi:hypothetical protein
LDRVEVLSRLTVEGECVLFQVHFRERKYTCGKATLRQRVQSLTKVLLPFLIESEREALDDI